MTQDCLNLWRNLVMTYETTKVRLADICKVNQGLQIPISGRFTTPGKDRYFYITIQFLKKNSDVAYYVDKPNNSVICKKDDILVVRTGSTGVVLTGIEGCFHNNFFKVVPDKTKVNPRFLYYFLSSPKIYKKMQSLAGVTVIQDLSHSSFYRIEINLPSLNIQKKIVQILDAYTDKVNLNSDLIAALEEYSQLLFHKWFVDFNFPDENGQPYKDNGGEMYVVEEKEIPSSWNIEPLESFIINTSNGDWGEEIPFEGAVETYCIRGADIPKIKHGIVRGTPLRYIKRTKDNAKSLKDGNIVIEASGGSPTQSTGRTVLIRDSLLNNIDKPMYFSNFSKMIVPKNNYSMFLYLLFNNLFQRDVFFHFEGKTSGIRNLLLNNLINKLEFVNPSIDVLKKFEEQIGLLWDKIFNLGYENEQLIETRDLIIKKLIK